MRDVVVQTLEGGEVMKEEECEVWWDGGDGKVEVTTFRGELRSCQCQPECRGRDYRCGGAFVISHKV